MHTNPGAPFRMAQIAASTAGISQPKDCRGYEHLTVYLTASAALSAGTLIVEEASWDPMAEAIYTGTWSQIASYTLSSVFASTGGQSAQHLPVTHYANVRTRIGTTVVGGTLATELEGS